MSNLHCKVLIVCKYMLIGIYSQENKLTPYQAELLATFDKGPVVIAEEELVAKIVAEEENAIRLRKTKKRFAAKKRQAWNVEAHQPETADVDDVEFQKGENNRSKRVGFEDDLGSMCTTMTFSTANVSNLNEDLIEMEITDRIVEKPKVPSLKKNKKILSRSRSEVARARDKRHKEEEERKRAKILNKKTRTVVKKEQSEVATKQQIWLHLVAHFCRASELESQLKKYRAHTFQIYYIQLQKRASRRIMLWFKKCSMRRRMRHNSTFLAKIRSCFCVYIRKRRVRQHNEAAAILSHFIASVNGASVRTQKLYKFRNRIVKIQTVFGQFYKCQRARLRLLFLAFQRELHIARLDRNHVKRVREKNSVRIMKRTHFFGEAVQKLDNICSSLTVMIARKNARNNLKMKQFLQLQNMEDKYLTNEQTPAVIPASELAHKTKIQKYSEILRRVLGNQRKRHILSQRGSEKTETKVMTHQTVDPMEVKAFLTTEGHVGPKYRVLDPVEIKKRKNSPLILLTGGAIGELKEIAKHIVAEEDEETLNYEIERRLLKEDDDDVFNL